MNVRFPFLARWLLVMGLVPLAGCPFRKEEIRVDRSGAVKMKLEYSGTLAELEAFDALPSEANGWTVSRELEEKKDDGEDEYVVRALRGFEPGDALPARLTPQGDVDPAIVLHHPTEIWTERRGDETWYFFRRTYEPRSWRKLEYYNEAFITDDIKALGEKPAEELTKSERRELVSAFAAVDAYRFGELVQTAGRAAAPPLPIDVPLRARQAALGVYQERIDEAQGIMTTCNELQGDELAACFEDYTKALASDARAAAFAEIDGLSRRYDAAVRAFYDELARLEKRQEITSTLRGHGFDIEVFLPGEPVAYNADSDPVESGGSVKFNWQFDGSAFMDRTHVLTAISRVRNE